MGNNPNGNKDIALAGVNTRFGSGGADPSAAAKKRNTEQNPSSIRLALQRIMATEIDITQPMTAEQIAKAFGRNGVKVSIAQAMAVRKVMQAHKEWKAMDSLIDHVDGKQVQAVVEAKVTIADILAASYDKKFLAEADDDESDTQSGA